MYINVSECEAYLHQHGYIDFSDAEKKEQDRVMRILLSKRQKVEPGSAEVARYLSDFLPKPSDLGDTSAESFTQRFTQRSNNNSSPLRVQVRVDISSMFACMYV